MVVGEDAAIENLDPNSFPVTWHELPPIKTIDDALAQGADQIHAHRPNNVLTGGRVVRGDVERALASCRLRRRRQLRNRFRRARLHRARGRICASRGRHASRFRPARNLLTWTAPTSRRSWASPPEAVRIIPTAVGGGFGSKLDLSVQPFVALAAWHLNRPRAMVYSRSRVDHFDHQAPSGHACACGPGATRDGKLLALDFSADFNTGAYSSWGPTVAARVPVHASGPYKVPHYRAITRAIHTHLVPAGAFRGFGVPQTAIAQEQVYDDLGRPSRHRPPGVSHPERARR